MLLLLGLLLTVAMAVERAAPMRHAARLLQARSVDEAAFGAGDTARILQSLDRLHQLPPDPGSAEGGVRGAGAHSIRRSRWEPLAAVLSLDPPTDTELASTLAVDPQWLRRGLPVLALQMRPEDFKRLQQNPNGRGREYEEETFVALLLDGELAFTSGAGLRVHGGKTRVYARLRSYRLHFRNRYGLRRFAPEAFPERRTEPPRTVVIGNNNHGLDAQGRRWHFVEPLTFDIVRRIGMPAPQTLPAVFFLNGENRGLVTLTEYIDADYLEAHYGHDRFILVRTKVNKNSPASRVKLGGAERYEELMTWIRETPEPSMGEAAERVDLDNLARWFLGIVFCATGDVFNGPLLLDQTDPEARWFWIAWDLEFSFGQPHFPDHQAGPTRDVIPYVLHPSRRRDARSALLQGLFASSPEFRAMFADVATEALNHRLTDAFLEERLAHYRDLLYRSPTRRKEFWDDLEAFVRQRKAIVRHQLAAHFGFGPSHRVLIRNPQGVDLVVDGYPVGGSSYRGWYYEGQTIEVQASGSTVTWRVDGRSLRGPELTHEVAGPATIRVVPTQ